MRRVAPDVAGIAILFAEGGIALMRRIVGICLFRNEEFFLERAIRNVAGFCDDLILVDNASNDFSPSVAQDLAARLRHVTRLRVESPHETQRLISHLAGTPTWVLGVDGDEIYDPAGLARLRPRLLDGEFDAFFQLRGHAVHCTSLDPVATLTATGYATPASRPVSKLYNFAGLHAWNAKAQRLHGWDMIFRAGYHYETSAHLNREQAWDACDLRLLHLCFLPRSRADLRAPMLAQRQNPSETRIVRDYKIRTYAVGEQVTVPIADFFPDLDGLPTAPPDRRWEGMPAAWRLTDAEAPDQAALAALFPSGPGQHRLAHLHTRLATHMVGRGLQYRAPIATLLLEAIGADLPVRFDGRAVVNVEVTLHAAGQPPTEDTLVSRVSLPLPQDLVPAGKRIRLELPIDARALKGSEGWATAALVVPGLPETAPPLAARLPFPLPAAPRIQPRSTGPDDF